MITVPLLLSLLKKKILFLGSVVYLSLIIKLKSEQEQEQKGYSELNKLSKIFGIGSVKERPDHYLKWVIAGPKSLGHLLESLYPFILKQEVQLELFLKIIGRIIPEKQDYSTTFELLSSYLAVFEKVNTDQKIVRTKKEFKESTLFL